MFVTMAILFLEKHLHGILYRLFSKKSLEIGKFDYLYINFIIIKWFE